MAFSEYLALSLLELVRAVLPRAVYGGRFHYQDATRRPPVPLKRGS
jgi:hypothetical protein